MATRVVLETKDPSDVKDYAIDWGAVLTAEGEVGIATSAWATSDPVGLDIDDDDVIGTKAVVWVSGGVAGTTYALTNTIVTSSGTPRTHERTISIPCKDR